MPTQNRVAAYFEAPPTAKRDWPLFDASDLRAVELAAFNDGYARCDNEKQDRWETAFFLGFLACAALVGTCVFFHALAN